MRNLSLKTSKNHKKRLGSNSLKIAMTLACISYAMPGFATVSAKIGTWATEIDASLTALVAIFAVVGGFLVFMQYMQGNQEAQKNLIKFVIGIGIFGLAKLIVAALAP